MPALNLRGPVEEVRRQGTLGQVRLRIGHQTPTAVISAEALDELKLQRGDNAMAMGKSTEVMIGNGKQAGRVGFSPD